MTQQGHFEEFAGRVTTSISKGLIEAYRAATTDAALSQLDVVNRLKTVLEQQLLEPRNASTGASGK
jgi:BMFP domain-containing protein YqiC